MRPTITTNTDTDKIVGADDPFFVFRFFNEIGIINQLASAEFQKALGGSLGPSEFGVLNHFVRLGDGTTPSRLASIFQVSKPSMTATLSKLAAKGFVEIVESDEDKRKKIVRLTDAGREAREAGVRATAPLAKRLQGMMDMDQLAGVLPVLQDLREKLDQARNGTLVE